MEESFLEYSYTFFKPNSIFISSGKSCPVPPEQDIHPFLYRVSTESGKFPMKKEALGFWRQEV